MGITDSCRRGLGWRMWDVANIAACAGMALLLLFAAANVWAGEGGKISGTVTDPSGAAVAKAAVMVTNSGTGVRHLTATDDRGFYSFPALPVGTYELYVSAGDFRPYRSTGIVIDANSAITVDAVLQIGDRSEAVTVIDNALHVETTSTQNGEVITSEQITAVPLNGRSFTDLLSLQP